MDSSARILLYWIIGGDGNDMSCSSDNTDTDADVDADADVTDINVDSDGDDVSSFVVHWHRQDTSGVKY